MEIAISIATLIGIIAGLSLAINGAEVRRLRNALNLATQQASEQRSIVDVQRVSLRLSEDALRRRDDELRMHDEKIRLLERQKAFAEAGELAADTEVQRLQLENDRLSRVPESGTPAGSAAGEQSRVDPTAPASRVVTAAQVVGDDDEAYIVPAVQDGEGWIEWSGGECPVEFDTAVEYTMRNGRSCQPWRAGRLLWNHENASWDIVRYRVVSPELRG